MADSYFDNAGGLQSVPDVNINDVGTTRYVTEANSMQSALGVNVLSGGVPSDGAVVTDGQTVSVVNAAGTDPHNGTVNVLNDAVSNVQLTASTVAMVDNGDTVAVDGETVTLTVANGALTGGTLPATITTVANGDLVSVIATDGTVDAPASVTNGNLSGVILPSSAALATDGMTLSIPVTGVYETGVTITVAGGVITGIELT